MYKIFFNNKGEQKKWFILFNIFLPIFFAAWGLVLSIKAYDLSVATSQNTEQIEFLKSQNRLLLKQISQISDLLIITKGNSITQQKQLELLLKTDTYSKRPKLKSEFLGSSYAEHRGQISNRVMTVILYSTAGDIYNLNSSTKKPYKIVSTGILKNKSFPNGASCQLELQVGSTSDEIYTIDLFFNDVLGNKYNQRLLFYKADIDYSFQLGPLVEIL